MFATFTMAGSSAAATQIDRGSRERSIVPTTIRCSSRSFGLCSSRSPRWSSTAGSALRRADPASATVLTIGARAADEQLGTRADERRLGRPDAEAVAARVSRPQRVEHRAGVERAPASDPDLTGEHHLVHLTCAHEARRLGHGPLVVLVATATLAMSNPPAGSGSASGSSASRNEATLPRARSSTSRASSPVRQITLTVTAVSFPLRASDTSGSTSSVAGREAHCGSRPPSGKKANPPTHTGPAPSRSGGSPITASRISSEHSRCGGAEAVARGCGIHRVRGAEGAEREPVTVGLLPCEPALVRTPAREHGRGTDRRRARARSWRSPAQAGGARRRGAAPPPRVR